MRKINKIVKRNVSDEFFLEQFLLDESPKPIVLDVHSSQISTNFTERFIAFPIEVLDVLFQNRRDDIVEMAVDGDFVVPQLEKRKGKLVISENLEVILEHFAEHLAGIDLLDCLR